MIQPYYGEFLVNPCPLELSLSPCSHGCRYCFIRLGGKFTKTTRSSVAKQLSCLQSSDNLAGALLREKYPVVLSNRTDPFCAGNWRESLDVIGALTAMDIPIFFQTKGGHGIDEALKIIKPSVWYITITTMDEKLAGKLEPGAPSPLLRLDMIEKLTSRGHGVIVGINPCVPEWYESGFLKPSDGLAEVGVWGVVVQALHLNSKKRSVFTKEDIAAMGSKVVDRAMKKKNTDMDFVAAVCENAKELGLRAYSPHFSEPSDFPDIFRKHYAKTFPVMQDLVNFAFAQVPDGSIVKFSTLLAGIPSLPTGKFNLSHYLYLSNTPMALAVSNKALTTMDYKQLLTLYLCDARHHSCLAAMENFSFVFTKENGEDFLRVDEQGNPLFFFSKKKLDSYYTVVPNF